MSTSFNKIAEKLFKISENDTTVKREIYAGIATFIAMSYIVIVNPLILKDASMSVEGVFIATALSAAFATFFMALYANLPIALAPGMGTNAWFTYGIVLGMGIAWQQALGAVFLSGVIYMASSFTPLRKDLIKNFPDDLKHAVSVGIGLFICTIGLVNANIITKENAFFITRGDLQDITVVLPILAIITMFALRKYLKIFTSIAIIIGLSAISVLLGLTELPASFVSSPGSIKDVFLQLDISPIFTLDYTFIVVLLTLFAADFFDTTGTLIGLFDGNKKLKQKEQNKALNVDAFSTSVGACLGTSTVTAFAESAVGIIDGKAKTGLTSFTVASLFLLTIFFSPLVSIVPSWAISPVLVYIGFLMFKNVNKIDWKNSQTAMPCFLTIVAMPLTYSIVNGFAFGIISWILILISQNKLSVKKHYSFILIVALYLVYIIGSSIV